MLSAKKLLLLLCFIVTPGIILAQHLQYGVTGGLQISQPKGFDSHTGFFIGGRGEVFLSETGASSIKLDFGLLFSSKGWCTDIYDDTETFKTIWQCQLYYLDIPIRLGYGMAVNKKIRLLINAGPYASIGISGKSTIKTNEIFHENANPCPGNLFTNGAYKRFDCGIDMEAGVQTGEHIRITVGYSMSLLKPTKENLTAISPKDRTYRIAATYYF